MGLKKAIWGKPITKRHAIQIIRRGKQAKRKGIPHGRCPYAKNSMQRSIWITAYRHAQYEDSNIWLACVRAGLQCNAGG